MFLKKREVTLFGVQNLQTVAIDDTASLTNTS